MARREYITRNVLFFSFIVTFSFALISLALYILGEMPLDTLILYSVIATMLAAAIFLTNAGYWRQAGIIPPLLMYFPAVNANYIGGIDAPGNFMYALMIIFVAIIYGYRKMWIALVICLVTYLCLAWMIAIGHIIPYRTAEVVFVNRVVLTSGFLVGIALMIWLLGRSYRSEIDVRIKAEELLNSTNEELGALNEALRESKEMYTKLIATMPDIMVRTNLQGEILFINDIGLSMGNYEDKEMIGQSMLSFIAPEDQKKAAQNTLLMFERKLGPQEYHLIMKDGSKMLFEVNGDVLRNEDGSPYGFVHICRNITDRKLSEEKGRNNEQFLRLITDNVQDAIRLVDLKTLRYTYANLYCQKLFGIAPQDYINSELGSNLEEEEKKRLYEFFQDEIEHDHERDPKRYRFFSLREKNKLNNEIIWTENKASFIRDANGRPTAVISITRDITEQKKMAAERQRLQERLGRSEKMEAIGTLAGGVAHDLNNVLGVLVGYSELMLEKIPEGSPLKKYAGNILNSSQRGAAIIQDLLTLARRGVAIAEVVNLNQSIENFLRTPEFENMTSCHPQVTFKLDLTKDILNIKGSPVHLGKTIMNLIANAAEAISGAGQVLIHTENRYLDQPVRGYDDMQEGDYVILTVSDNGQGISAQDIGKIFEPFYTKKVMGKSGTGLGLAVVWGTVKDHNGYIDVWSEEGKGTTFTIYFPATREAPEKIATATPPDYYMSKGESILVVDDVEDQRQLAISMLERLGYQVDAVNGGEEAVEYLKKKKADLIVLDMIMDPGIDGMETYRRILAINPGQKAIIVSGFSETDQVSKAQKMGAGAFVRKPYIMEKIGLAIRKELDRK